MTTYTDASGAPIDSAFLAEITDYLAGYGLEVRKVRKVRSASTESAPGREDGAAPARAPKGHTCAEHWRVPGMRKPVCIEPKGATIREDGKDTGELVPDAWTDTDTVLAFAVDVASRMPRASYTATEQRATLPEHWRRSTYNAVHRPDPIEDVA